MLSTMTKEVNMSVYNIHGISLHIMRTTCQHLTLNMSISCVCHHVPSLNIPFYILVLFETMCKCKHVLLITDEISRPDSRSAGVLNGASPSSTLASLMSLLMANPGLLPISIEPSVGVIEPSAMQNFSIRFSPLEVAQFQSRLVCRYSNKEFCCENS